MKRVMHIGDEVFVHGYVDEIRNDTIIIRNAGGYFGTSRDEVCYEDDGYGTMNEADRKTEPIPHDDYVEWGNDHIKRNACTLELFDDNGVYIEPQTKCYLRTSCDHYGDKQVCGRCREYNLYSHTKTEPQTDCLTCKHSHDKWYHPHCDSCSKAHSNYEPQTDLVNDSQVLAKDLVDDEFNPYDEECMRCKHLKLKCEFIPTYCKFESRDEPQTEYNEYREKIRMHDPHRDW